MNSPEIPLRTQLVGTALWRRLDAVSLDHFCLQESMDGYLSDGRVLTVFDSRPAEVHYAVFCGPDWVTRHVHVILRQGETSRRLELRRNADGQWSRDGVDLMDFASASDVDLSITPATNTLPIRRLALDVGGSASVDAVWVRFPDLTLERLSQRYLRTAERSYAYESGDGAFAAELDVDEAGVVVRYSRIWERVAP